MIEQLAAAAGRDVSRETYQRLEAFVSDLLEESERQNLVSAGSRDAIWERHILDGAQLLRFAPRPGSWVDIGSGAGLPGMVLAILSGEPTTLVEPRRLRAEFLERERDRLGLGNVAVAHSSAASVEGSFDYVTARAVAATDRLFALTKHLTHRGTIFILPKGKSAQSELDAAQRTWQGAYRLEQSLTSDDGKIIVASQVRRKGKR